MKGVLIAAALMAGVAWAASAPWHDDPVAGVRFQVPFADGDVKTAAQVTALVLEKPGTELPEGAQFTSGVYAKGGLPYIVVWTRPDAAPPNRSNLTALAQLSPEEAKARFGLSDWQFDLDRLSGTGSAAGSGGLKSRTIIAVARGATVGVGLYYADAKDAALFEPLAGSVELAGEKRLGWTELPRGPAFWLRAGAAALAAVVAAVSLGRRRRPEL